MELWWILGLIMLRMILWEYRRFFGGSFMTCIVTLTCKIFCRLVSCIYVEIVFVRKYLISNFWTFEMAVRIVDPF